MLYIANIQELQSLSEKESDKLSIVSNDTLVLIEDDKKQPSIPLDRVIWLFAHVHTSDIRLISKNSPAALITLGTFLTKSPDITLIGNPFGLNPDEQKTYISEVFKDYNVTVFGNKKRAVPRKKEIPQTVKETKGTKPQTLNINTPKAKPIKEKKTKGKPVADSFLSRLGVTKGEFTKEEEEKVISLLKNADDYETFKNSLIKIFPSKAGTIIVKTIDKKIEELKNLC